MITLTNKEASGILSKTATLLFSDSDRPFPCRDSFLLIDIVKTIEQRLKPYHQKFRDIVKKYDGKVIEENKIVFKDDDTASMANKELTELNETPLEYPFQPLEVKDDWPRLSLAEALILKPLTRNGKNAGYT